MIKKAFTLLILAALAGCIGGDNGASMRKIGGDAPIASTSTVQGTTSTTVTSKRAGATTLVPPTGRGKPAATLKPRSATTVGARNTSGRNTSTTLAGSSSSPISGVPNIVTQSPITSISIGSDQKVYRSYQDMILTLVYESDRDIDDSIIIVKGILAGNIKKKFFIDKNMTVKTSKGENKVEVKYMTPACNKCSGIRAGNYSVTFYVTEGLKTLAAGDTIVQIRQ
ncbi:hypothetical protein ACFLRF_03755 [Candidatus Altiarchaeota archaeon]